MIRATIFTPLYNQHRRLQHIYRDKNGRGHSIDFDVCATTFKAEHGTSSGNCIGERKMDECYFVFYTSGIKTKIVFKTMHVGNLFQHHLLSGSRANRFLRLQELINETRYTTLDLS